MSRNFTLNQLTEGIRDRNIGAEGTRLIEKWSRTGLLRGLADHNREIMSRLLENQAAQLLREQNSISTGGGSLSSSGDLQGFTNIAFPIVRRVFGGLVANELVSIQPMSLPSGLLFYLDYTYGTDVGGDDSLEAAPDGVGTDSTYTRGESIYGAPTGKDIRKGANAVGGNYDLIGSTYSKVNSGSGGYLEATLIASGAYQSGGSLLGSNTLAATGSDGKLIQFDVQVSRNITQDNAAWQTLIWDLGASGGATFENMDLTNAKGFALFSGDNETAAQGLEALDNTWQQGTGIYNLRRLNQVGTYTALGGFVPDPFVTLSSANAALLTVVSGTMSSAATAAGALQLGLSGSYAIADSYDTSIDGSPGATLVIPSFESNFASSPQPIIPEIDIKIESIAVTAATRKLRARWSPELAQDLNAYHSLDAEVELTQILSEQIAIEIDREILNDLLVEARGANYYWSRSPGKFVNKTTGNAVSLASSLSTGPSFTGTVREWYETLVETIIDVANEIHRKTLRGSANFLVCSPEVATIFEASILYKPSLKIDGQGQVSAPFQLGAASIGSLSNRFTVYKDPYFPRNKILIGYKGGSYLETGYVYAPYVPLIVTPTIFAPEDFTPRKGVMTRYGKKMVRGDFYGTVTCLDMDII